MEFKKAYWTNNDVTELNNYLLTLINKDKIIWTQNIINTKLPVLAIPAPKIKKIAQAISQGNYFSYLDLCPWAYYESTIINGYLIIKIKDFKTFKKYLDIYSTKVDNWSSCDIISINVNTNPDDCFNLILEYIKSPLPFQRRIGLRLLFKFIDKDQYISKVFDVLNTFSNESEYYVNMINAWLVCECFIKRRHETITFLNNHKLNKFTINKAISKCRDSYRVSDEDKEMLLKYRVI